MVFAAVCTILLTLLPIHGAVAGSVTALAPVADADQRLGLCDVLPAETPAGIPWTQLAYNAGARTNRWEFRWDALEPQAAQWNFNATDLVVAQSRQAGLDVLGVIDGTPRWATAPGQPPGNGVPKNLALPITDNRNLWAAFIRGLVMHYRGQVGYWEIWNEPDLHFFWNGNADDYVGLLRVAYQVIKHTDPSAQVMMAGMVVPDMQFFTQVLQNADGRRVEGKQPFDLAAWHVYGAATEVYPDLLRFKGLLDTKGFSGTPVWVTEDGFPASNPAGEPRQAAYVFETIAYALAAGAVRVLIYRASADPLPKQWGLLTATGTPRMGYLAFQVAAEYLGHTGAITYVPEGSIERFVFYQPKRRVTVLWNSSNQSHALRLNVGHVVIGTVDWQGVAGSVKANAAGVSVQVPAATYNQGIDPTNSVVGGPPQLVLEDNTLPPHVRPALYLPPVSGDNRRMYLLNPTNVPADLVVSALDRPLQREVIHLLPQTLATVNLDLLGGLDYLGMYAVSSSGPVIAGAVSTAGSLALEPPSRDWYLASTPPVLTLHNPGTQTATVAVTGYGAGGRVRVRRHLEIAPGSVATLMTPLSGTHAPKALVVHGSAPVVVLGSQSNSYPAAVSPQASWYLLHPTQATLRLFNPGKFAAGAEVRLIGAGSVHSIRLHLPVHGSVSLPVRRARAVVVIASRGLVLGYQASAATGPLPSYRPDVQEGFTAAGGVTRVDLFNPTGRTAAVTVRLVVRSRVTRVRESVPALHITSLIVRSPAGAATGVIVRSDIPIVAAPA